MKRGQWQSLAQLQQQAQLEELTQQLEEARRERAQQRKQAERAAKRQAARDAMPEPPDEINATGLLVVALLHRWRANLNDEGAATETIAAVFGADATSIGSIVRRMMRDPAPIAEWLVDLAHVNGARMADVTANVPLELVQANWVVRSRVANEIIKLRLEPRRGSCHGPISLQRMSHQVHMALLAYWRERRELLYEIQPLLRGGDRGRRVTLTLRSVELLVRKLEEVRVTIMAKGGRHENRKAAATK